MDLGALQKMLSDDSATGRTPLMVIADVGTPVTGHVDNISRIRELCKIHETWLHLRGHSLAALTLCNYQRNGHVSFISLLKKICYAIFLSIDFAFLFFNLEKKITKKQKHKKIICEIKRKLIYVFSAL